MKTVANTNAQPNEQQLQEALRLGVSVVSELWFYSTSDWVTSVHAADIDGDGDVEMVVGSRDGSVRAVTKKGLEKWRKSEQRNEWIGAVFCISNIAASDRTRVVVGSRNNTVTAYDEEGQVRWQYPTRQVVRRIRVIDIDGDGKAEVVVGSEDRSVYVLSCDTGELMWSYETNGWIRSVLSYDIDGDEEIETLAASGDKHIYVLDSKGQLKWKYNTGSKIHTLNAADLDRDGETEILIGSDAKDLYAMTHDGRKKWQFFPKNRIHTINIVDLNHDGFDEVIAGSEDEYIYILDCHGTLLWKHFLGYRIFSIFSVDLDQDGLWEILVGTENNSMQVLRIELAQGLLPRIVDIYNALGCPAPSALPLSPTERSLLRSLVVEQVGHEPDKTLAHVAQQLAARDFQAALSNLLTLDQQHVQLLWVDDDIGHVRTIAVKKSPRTSQLEIIVGTDEGDIKAFNCEGTALWSYSLEERVRTICLVDLNQDGVTEIVVGTTDGRVNAISDVDQTIKWQTQLDDWIDSICTTDINATTSPEMIVCSADRKIHIYTNNLSSIIEPIVTPQSIQTVRTHDINGDGIQEIIAGGQSDTLYTYTREGQMLWKYPTGDRVNTIAIVDIDHDGQVEILVGSEDRNLYVLDHTGNLKWRYYTSHRVLDVHALDANHDGEIEVFVGVGNGKLHVLNSVGDMLWQFEVNDRIRVVYGADLNNDGLVELLVGSEDRLYILQMLDKTQLQAQLDLCWHSLLMEHTRAEVLTMLCQHEDPTLRAFALTKIAEQPTLSERDVLLIDALLVDDAPEIKKAFAASIVSLSQNSPRKIRTFIEMLSLDQQRDIRLSLIESIASLAYYNPPLSFEYLDRFTRNINVWIRRAVVRKLDQLFVAHPQPVFKLLLTTIQDSAKARDDADWICQESARVMAHYLDTHVGNLPYATRLLLVRGVESSLLSVIIHCATSETTRQFFSVFLNLRTSGSFDTILERLAATVRILQSTRSFLCGDSMYTIYSEFYKLHNTRTINDIAQYHCSLQNTHQLDATDSGEKTYFDHTFHALSNINVISNTVRIYLRRRGLGESISSLLDAITAIDKLSHDLTHIYFAWCQPPEQFPDYTILILLLARWRNIMATELRTLRGKAELQPELRTKKVPHEERVSILLSIQNTGRSPADHVAITLKANSDFSIVEHPVRVFETISTHEPITAEFTIVPYRDTLRLTFDIKYDDAEAKAKVMPFGDKVELVAAERLFTRIRNPYYTGTPVQDRSMFYGRQDELTQLQEDFVYSSANTVVVLYGQRRAGKSSLLYTLVNTDVLDPHIPVRIDMQRETMDFSTSKFLRNLAHAIYRMLAKRKIRLAIPQKAAFDEDPTFALDLFLDKVETVLGTRKLVILIDEFEILEEKVAKHELSKDIFVYLRSLMQDRSGIHFLLAGTHMIKELTAEYWSVFFNIASHRRLSKLTEQAAQLLITQPVEGRVEYDPFAIEKIRHLTGDQPYLIQLICHALIQHCNTHRKNYLTINDVNITLDEVMQTGNTYFNGIWQQAPREERVMMAVVSQEGGDEGRYVSLADIERIYRDNNWPYKREGVLHALQSLCDGDVLVETAREHCYKIKIELTRTWLRDTKSLKQVILEEDLLDWH